MKDCAKQQIEIGDICATNQAGYTYALILYEVIGFTDKKVKLAHNKNREEVLKFPEQICVVKGYNENN